MKSLKHWQDAVNVMLGAWLVLSPWALGFAAEPTATANMVLVGALLVAAALGAIFVPRAWEEWTEGVIGVGMIASPWLLGFAATVPARNVAVLTGLAVAALACWTIIVDKDYGAWRHKEKPAQ